MSRRRPTIAVALLPALAGLVLAGLTLAGPGSARAQQPEPEGLAGAPVVREVRVEGLVRVTEPSVQRRVMTQPGTRLDPKRVSDDLERIFLMNFFEDVRVEAEDVDGGIALIFVVEERPAIRRVVFQGHDEVDLDDIEKVVDIPTYEIVNVPKIQANLNKVREVYRDQGFHLADVSYELVRVDENLVDLVFHIVERAKIKVKRITFLGNKALSDEELRGAMMGTREGGFFSFLTQSGLFKREYFEQDLRILKDYYAQNGYITARIDDPVVTLSRDQEFLYITIHVVEGRRYRVGEVKLEGDFLNDDQSLLAAQLTLKTGDVFSTAAVRADTRLVGGRYRDQGYAYANVSSDYALREAPEDAEHPEPIVDFTYVLQKGFKVRFGEIRMSGNDSTRDLVLRRELTISEGDWYSETGLERSRAKIMRLGFFDEVKLKTSRGARDELMDVIVEVKERQTGTFQVGAGFSSFESFLATAQVSKQNFMGRGQTLAFQALLSSMRTLFTVRFYEPHFFDSDFSFSLNVYNYQQDYDDFARGSTGGEMTWGYWITDDLVSTIGYKIEDVSASRGRRGAAPLANLFDDGLTSSLQLALIFDTRDDRMFPTNGWYLNGSVEWADRLLGSENEFTRMSFRGNRYFPLFWGLVLKLNLTTGWVFSQRPEGVPIFERFFVGGIFTVRGFPRFSLGPTEQIGCTNAPDASTCPFNKGGNKQLVLNAEIEFPILQQVGIRGVVFVDAGNAFDDDQNIDFLGLRTSWGFGIRWWSPMGPLRFEWGFPIDRRPGEDRYVFEFTIGNAF